MQGYSRKAPLSNSKVNQMFLVNLRIRLLGFLFVGKMIIKCAHFVNAKLTASSYSILVLQKEGIML
ncbi:hypothetical protein CYJ36_18880 [Bacillus sp. UMB0893]|nr:hypothetical protein CYJ36_18880 [Bacillus sp. UMB0893]